MNIGDWSNFFLGELGAAAALSGLLFVSLSVNQARILELGRMADRGLDALAMLSLVLVVASLPLVPGQPPRVLGGEIAALGLITLALTLRLQRAYLAGLEPSIRRRSRRLVGLNRLAVTLIVLGGVLLAARGDALGLYLVMPGILLSFIAAGCGAWVLLIEINR